MTLLPLENVEIWIGIGTGGLAMILAIRRIWRRWWLLERDVEETQEAIANHEQECDVVRLATQATLDELKATCVSLKEENHTQHQETKDDLAKIAVDVSFTAGRMRERDHRAGASDG